MAENTNESRSSVSARHKDSFEDQELIEKWTREQDMLRSSLKMYDTEQWQINRSVKPSQSSFAFSGKEEEKTEE